MLKELQKKLAAKAKELDDLQTKAFGDDGTAEDMTALETALKECEDLEAKIKVAERVQSQAKNGARDEREDDSSSRSAPVTVKTPKDATEKLGVFLQGMYKAHVEDGKASPRNVQRALEEMGYGGLPGLMGAKALTTLTGPSGGFAVPEDFSEQLIPLLYVGSSFMQGNPVRLPMPRGNWRQAGGESGAVASYRGEGDDIAVTAPTFRDISMSAHLLSAIVPATNQFLDYSVAGTAEFVRNDLSMAMSLKMDETAYFGSGTGDMPLGILRQADVLSIAAPAGTAPNVGVIEGTAKQALALVSRFPILRNRLAWRMSPRTHLYLSTLRSSGGDEALIYPTLTAEGGTWMGIPVVVAGTFSDAGGTGTNESSIALISFGNVLVGESKGLVIDISDSAAYRDANGDIQSAFSTDSTLFRARMEHDFAARYVEAVVLITGVQWGAAE